ncbi:MAG: 2-oxoacid:acceptor oxidoreductase family protein [Gemmatimonadota bacterium]|nr:MAG: 2-oxoacid:acceptor oxidoreductase family protein [Gemmatimonadota bacterium]
MRKEIQLAGFGGQGIVLSGLILGEAAILDGMNAVQTQSYGPESRGGAARSDVIISDAPIDYPKVVSPDILVVLSQPAYDKYRSEVGKKAMLIIDSDLVESDESALCVPFSKLADELGRRIVANVIMLGTLAKVSECVTRDSLERAVLRNIPKGTEELNLKALDAGFRSA